VARLEVRRVCLADPLTDLPFAELRREYRGQDSDPGLLTPQPEDYEPPGGALLLLLDAGLPVAGGGYRRYDHATAELRFIWTLSWRRLKGLARRAVSELEHAAAAAGYRRACVTTTPPPAAGQLLRRAGYTRPPGPGSGSGAGAGPDRAAVLALTKDLPLTGSPGSYYGRHGTPPPRPRQRRVRPADAMVSVQLDHAAIGFAVREYSPDLSR
jgi:polar amino acid transport system permease protein